jgi:hypothetical protein
VPPFIVPGNHDVQNDRLESVLETQPLGVLFRSGAARPLIGWSPYVPYLYGVPWQQDWANLPNALAEWPVSPWDESGCLVVTHAPIFPVSMAPTVFEYTPAADWAAAMGGKGNVYYGHIHEAHGVYTDGGVTFANVGALSRGSLHEYDLTRQVSVCSWSASTGFTPIPLNAKPASEVFRLAEIMEAKDATGAFDDFLANVGNSTIAITSIESVMEEVGQRDGVTPQLAALVRDLLANVA